MPPIDHVLTETIPRVPTDTGQIPAYRPDASPVAACPFLRHPGAARVAVSWAWLCAFATLGLWSAALARFGMLLWALR